jgi:hypothetical protein
MPGPPQHPCHFSAFRQGLMRCVRGMSTAGLVYPPGAASCALAGAVITGSGHCSACRRCGRARRRERTRRCRVAPTGPTASGLPTITWVRTRWGGGRPGRVATLWSPRWKRRGRWRAARSGRRLLLPTGRSLSLRLTASVLYSRCHPLDRRPIRWGFSPPGMAREVPFRACPQQSKSAKPFARAGRFIHPAPTPSLYGGRSNRAAARYSSSPSSGGTRAAGCSG